jgi:hypothetical protein
MNVAVSMNVDLLNALTVRSAQPQAIKLVSLERAIDTLPTTIRAEIIDIAVAKSDSSHRFVLTLLLQANGQKLVVESDIAAPKGAVLQLQRQGLEIQWRPPSPVQQLQALVQLQQQQLLPLQTSLPNTMDELRQWQQQLQSQSPLTRPVKQQLALIHQLLSQPLTTAPPLNRPTQSSTQQYVLNSGAFLEATLAQRGVAQATISDQKLLLMRLFRLLQHTPTGHLEKQPLGPTMANNTAQAMSAWVSRPIVFPLQQPTTLASKPISPLAQQLQSANVTSHWPGMTGKSLDVVNLMTPAASVLPTFSHPVKQPHFYQNISTHPGQMKTSSLPITAQLILTTPSLNSAASLASSPNATSALANSSNDGTSNNLLNLLLRYSNSPTPEVFRTTPLSGEVQGVKNALPTAPSITLDTALPSAMRLLDGRWLISPQSNAALISRQTTSPSLAPDNFSTVKVLYIANTEKTSPALLPTTTRLAADLLAQFSTSNIDRDDSTASYVALAKLSFGVKNTPLDQSAVASLIPRQTLEIAGFWLPLANLTNNTNKRIESNVDRLMRHVIGGIARIHSLQLDALAVTRDSAGNATPAAQWQLEIPLPMGDRWQTAMLNIYREDDSEQEGSNKHDEHNTRWGMRLCFDLAPFGQLTADASLCGHRVEAKLWTDGMALQARVEPHIDQLLLKLREAGLYIEEIPCRVGNAPPLRTKRNFEVETTS